jgi:hypothetical protein
MSMGKFGSLEICGLRYVTFWMDVVVLSGRCLDAEVSSVAITSRVSYIADAHQCNPGQALACLEPN